MINLLKRIWRRDKKTFSRICNVVGLNLDFSKNKDAVDVLKAIFEEREYADYFPFYKKVTVVDIGAHYGYFSIFAAKNTSPNSRIFSIEPSQSNFETLNENLKDGKIRNVTNHQIAIVPLIYILDEVLIIPSLEIMRFLEAKKILKRLKSKHLSNSLMKIILRKLIF
jgi:abortive infection bacteriophage resistance protein